MDSRDRLCDAAIGLVAERGLEQTTVAALIARAGVSREAFYAQFTTKVDCWEAAVLRPYGHVRRLRRDAGAADLA